ncbi:hypothetical protein EST38_g11400 [Candolleomyces aberdarensis]|uniref:BAG domain-containing protein n=1 Tax=Candolleomyces aberdarensis TaxID=2316362 RepID=A0A4Q2D4Y4_9AGAR|nr:hypothetical protein EST38_g11400 [Candolleomyces aberdarensis]
MSVTVKWGRDRLAFALPPKDTPLSAIRQSLREYTQLHSFKLVHKGAVLKDDQAPISHYHIAAGSVLMLLPTADDVPVMPSSQESALLTTISTELATVRSSLVPELNQLLAAGISSQAPAKDYLRLGELLLQSLLRLDGLAPETGQARQQRKEAVKEIQALLDALDETIAARKAAGLQ